MTVVRDLKRIQKIMQKISKIPNCYKITGWMPDQIGYFNSSLARAIKRYESEARRVKKYYRR